MFSVDGLRLRIDTGHRNLNTAVAHSSFQTVTHEFISEPFSCQSAQKKNSRQPVDFGIHSKGRMIERRFAARRSGLKGLYKNDLQLYVGIFQMISGRVLIFFGQGKKIRFTVQFRDETDAGGLAAVRESIGNGNKGMPGEVA